MRLRRTRTADKGAVRADIKADTRTVSEDTDIKADTRTRGHADIKADTRTRFVYEAPDMPARRKRDLGADMDRALLMISGAVTFGVGNWSICTLMRDAGAPWAASIGAAGVFDLIALSASVRVYRLRATPHKALGPMLVMMLSVALSMSVNGYHGFVMGGWTVCAVLGAVPLAFESVWLMQHGMKPWAVLWNFQDERRSMIRRDAHAALYGMSSRADMPAVSADTRTVSTDTDTDTDIKTDTPVYSPRVVRPMRKISPRADMAAAPPVAVRADINADTRTVSTDTDIKADTRKADTRAIEVADMLASGSVVTGKTLAALYGVTDRTGRRILSAAHKLNGAA